MFRKILLLVLGFLILALIVAAIVIRPYYKMPPEGKDVLDAKAKEYRLVADAAQNRPKADTEAFWAIIKEVEPAKKKIDEKIHSLSAILVKDSCPTYDLESLRKAEAEFKAVTALDTKLKAVLENGFVLYQDVSSFDAKIPSLIPYRNYTFSYLADAILNAVDGRSDVASDRISSVMSLSYAALQTPVLIYNMVGIAIAATGDFVLISLMPKLVTEDLQAIRKKMSESPDAMKNFLDTMKVESVSITDAMTRNAEYFKGTPSNAYRPLLKRIGFLDRGKYLYISVTSRLIDGYTAWYKSGAKEKIQLMDSIKKDLMYGIIVRDLIPNFDSLILKVWERNLQRNAVIDAIDSELSLRESGMRTKLELPYDEDCVIVIDKDTACIVQKNK